MFLHSCAERVSAAAAPDKTLPFLERFATLKHGKLEPNPGGIDDREYALLRTFVRDTFGLELPRHAAYRAVLALMKLPLRELGPDELERCLQLHVALGTVSPFAANFFRELIARYGVTEAPEVSVRLETHLKLDGVPLLLFQQLFGPKDRLHLVASSYSGHPLMRGLAELAGIDVEMPSRSQSHPLMAPALPKEGEPRLVVEKAAKTLAAWQTRYGKEEIRAALTSGRVVVIPHNRDDTAAVRAIVGDLAESRCLNHTRMKRLEARLIGERQMLQVAELTRRIWKSPVGDAPLVVVGAGLIGGELAEAALRLGMPPEQVIVVDPDPEVQRRFAAHGCKVAPGIGQGHARVLDLERAVVVHASPGSLFDLDNVFQFAKDTIFLSLTSDGKGLRWQGTSPQLHVKSSPDHVWETGYDWASYRDGYPDVELWHHGRLARVIARGYPPNLLDEQWSYIFELTTCLVAASVLQAMREPGGEGASALPRALDDRGVELFSATHGSSLPPFKGYSAEAWRALLDDFRGSGKPPQEAPIVVGMPPPPPGFRLVVGPQRRPSYSPAGYKTIILDGKSRK